MDSLGRRNPAILSYASGLVRPDGEEICEVSFLGEKGYIFDGIADDCGNAERKHQENGSNETHFAWPGRVHF